MSRSPMPGETMAPKAPAATRGPDISVNDVANAVLRRLPLVAVALVLGVGAGVAHLLLAKPMFTSTAQVMVMRKSATAGKSGDAAVDEGRVSDDLLATHVELLKSHLVVGDALKTAGLMDLPSIPALPEGTPVDYITSQLSVTRGGTGQARQAHTLVISLAHPDAADARKIILAIVDSYQRFLKEKFENVNVESVELIRKAAERLSVEQETAEARYEEFRRSAPSMVRKRGDSVSNVHTQRFEEYTREITALQVLELAQKAQLETVEKRLAEVEASGGDDVDRLAVIDSKTIERMGVLLSVNAGDAKSATFQEKMPQRMELANLDRVYAEMQMKEKTLIQNFGASHPDVVNVRAQIAGLKQFLTERRGFVNAGTDQTNQFLDPTAVVELYVRMLRANLTSTSRKLAELQQLAQNEEQLARSLVSFELQDETLKKQILRAETLYDDVAARLRESTIAQDTGGFVNEVIEAPEDGRQTSPLPLISIPAGVLMGLLLAAALVAIAEFRDRRFRSMEEIEQALQLPVLALIRPLGHQDSASRSASKTKVAATIPTHFAPKSPRAEQFRTLRTRVTAVDREQSLRVVQFTSALQGDGKSTITANYVVTYAQLGKKVLLIDCDMRRPSQHVLFALPNDSGLSTLLKHPEQDIASVIQQTEVQQLSLITAGPRIESPAEQLGSQRFAELVAWARANYDLVVLDCPPVLPVADPSIICKQADGTLMVVRVAKDSRSQVAQAASMLAGVGANMVGTVVNVTDSVGGFVMQTYGYGYGYGFDYGYGGYETDSEYGNSAATKPATNEPARPRWDPNRVRQTEPSSSAARSENSGANT